MSGSETFLLIAAVIIPAVCVAMIVVSLILMIIKIRKNKREPSQKLTDEIGVFRTVIILSGVLLAFFIAAVAPAAFIYDGMMRTM